jgi:hypothetical protein
LFCLLCSMRTFSVVRILKSFSPPRKTFFLSSFFSWRGGGVVSEEVGLRCALGDPPGYWCIGLRGVRSRE